MRYKILIIEDNRPLAENLAESMEFAGYTMLTAFTGKTGIDLSRNEQPDIICCDISLGDMTGLDVLQQLALHPETHRIPVILITGDRDTATMRKGMEHGAYDYLVKPFSGIDLLRAVKTQLAKREALERRLTTLQKNIRLALPHELRTPLTGILGFSEILLSLDTPLPLADLKEIGTLIHLSGERMLNAVERVLISVGLDLQISSLPAVPACIKQVSNPVLTIPHLARKTATQYERSTDLKLFYDDTHNIVAIPKYFEMVLSELLDNAFKFSEKGSQVEVTAIAAKNEYHVLVINRARNISTALIEMGEEFMQMDRQVHEQQGMGLGLALVKKIMRLHGTPLLINLSGKKVSAQLRFKLCDDTCPFKNSCSGEVAAAIGRDTHLSEE